MEEQSFSLNQDILAAGNIWDWFAGLPVVVHLLLAAAVISLLAAAAFSRAAQAGRQRVEREQGQRAEERDFLLRKDVYLPAAEAIARAQEFLAKVPASELSKEGAQAVIDQVMGGLGKVHLVASEQTLKSTMAFATEFSSAFLELSAKRRPLVETQNEIDSLESKISHLSVERDHLLASITRLAGDGLEQHGAIWGDMNMRFDKLHREIAGLIGQRSDKIATLSRMRREFSAEAAGCSLKLAKLGVPAYLALRQELGVPVDELDYRGLAQRNIAEIERALRVFSGESGRAAAVPHKLAEAKKAKADAAPGESAAKPHEAKLKMVLKRSS